MEYGKVAGLEKPVSRIVQGTMAAGGEAAESTFAMLDSVLEQGGNCFDTAHIYGGGESERIFGRWIRDRGVRERVVILGKGAHHSQDRKRVTPFDIAADLHDSLARMQVDCIDLYLLHRDDPDVPVGPIVEALNEHRKAGKIRAFGGSNWSHDRIRQANDYAQANGLMGFSASSPQFSLGEQLHEPWDGCVSITGPANAGARRYYQETQLPLFTWSSLAAGFFSGQITRSSGAEGEDGRTRLAMRCYGSEENFLRLDRVMEVARLRGVLAAQVALAWVHHQRLNVFTLVGARNPEEFRINASALEVSLTPAELAYVDLTAASPD